ncbi:YlbG family protein [Ectobacillus panaciterrae]|uniref:YlbG family protein n=1 Tax=Ectobacillus panaciterrae TaxID=363872 RepID=UPI0004252D9C|nr:YlbG family protein [Ectobacillus panaciterrae]
MFGQRQGIIVYLHSLKHAKLLRKYGNIHYISRRFKYVVLYCDMSQIDFLMEKLNSFPFVKRVEPSYRPFLKTEFENSKPDRAKEYDYKID